MMVSDDNINSQLFGMFNFSDRTHSAIHANHQITSLLAQLRDSVDIQTVSFIKTVWNIIMSINPQMFEHFQKQRSCSCTINIVIAINPYLLAIFNCVFNTLNGPLHVVHQKGRIHHIEAGIQKIFRLLFILNSANCQQLRKEGRNAQLSGNLSAGFDIRFLYVPYFFLMSLNHWFNPFKQKYPSNVSSSTHESIRNS